MKKYYILLLLSLFALVLHGCGKQESEEEGEIVPEDCTVIGQVEAVGSLIDVRSLAADAEIYPQNENYKWDAKTVSLFPSGISYAVSLHKNRGPEKVRCMDGSPLIAVSVSSLDGWKPTGKSFSAGGTTYTLMRPLKYRLKSWVEIPQKGSYSCILFGKDVSVNDINTHGLTVIAKVSRIRSATTISNADIIVLPDGSYLACCTGSSYANRMALFKSEDKGEVWQYMNSFTTANTGIYNYPTFFILNQKLYVIGCTANTHGPIGISRSDDWGRTWSKADSDTTGLILSEPDVLYHAGPGTGVVVANGRIWKAWEVFDSEDDKYPFMLSCPVDADLLKASNWTKSNVVKVGHLWEGNAVALSDGTVYNIIRNNDFDSSNLGALLKMNSATSMSTPSTITLPGGGKKFKVMYDEKSKLFWTLSNPHVGKKASYKHDGIYATGLKTSLQRNNLVLASSPDLKNWTIVKDKVVYDEDPFFHGFQYASWDIDGDDMVVVLRTGAQEFRGLPYRQHDANMFTFFKIRNFRDIKE